MISIRQAEQIHHTLIESFGGSHGTRDKAALASALARPFHTFGSNDLYATTLEKAAFLY